MVVSKSSATRAIDVAYAENTCSDAAGDDFEFDAPILLEEKLCDGYDADLECD